MRLASIDQKDKKDEMLTPIQAQQQQMMQQEKGMGSQMLDMAKQKAMSGVLDQGTKMAMSGLGNSAMGSAAMTAMPYVGAGLMGAKLLGLFEHGGLVGPLSPKYRSEGTKPDYLDLDGDGNKTEPMKEAAKEKKPQYNAEGNSIPMPMMRPVPMPMMKPNIMGMKYLQENPQDAAMSLEGYEPILDGSYVNPSPVMSEIDRMRADYLKSLGE